MSITDVTSTSYTNPYAKVKDDFKDISTALKAGNLSDAQKAYATLQTDAPSQASNTNNPMSQDLQSLGNSLNSGNLADAQKSLAQIQKHMKGHGDFAKQQQEMQAATASDPADTTQAAPSDTSSTNPLQQAFQSLSAALSSGNLADAQKAFATVQSDLAAQKASNSTSTTATAASATAAASATSASATTSNNPLQQDFQALGSALSSGNLTDAQKAFAALQTDRSSQEAPAGGAKGAGHHHHHHEEATATTSTSATSTDAASNGDSLEQAFQSLSSALDSGNLTDAQNAFATVQSDLAAKNASNPAGTTAATGTATPTTAAASAAAYAATGSATATPAPGGDPLQQDFQALGSALSSGNLSDAQKAFATVQKDLSSQDSSASGIEGTGQQQHHHHHGAESPSSTAATAATNATSADSSSSLSLSNTLNSAVSSYLNASTTNYGQTDASNTLLSSAAYL